MRTDPGPPGPQMMQAVLHERYGDPGLLRVAVVPVPEPGPGEVLMRIHAASVHADVWHTVVGQPYMLRLMGNGVRRPTSRIPGTDAAGVVVRMGPGTSHLEPGDRVFGEIVRGIQWHNGGAFAQYAAVPEAQLRTMPAAMGFVEAAAIPTSALIALRALRVEARVQAGDDVLVNGAAGGVGMFVVQLAKAAGARVTGVDAGDRLDLVRQLGADDVLDYRTNDFTAADAEYDAVVDIPGNHPFRRIRRVLGPDGRYVLIGHDQYGAAGRRWLGGFPTVAGLMVRSLWTPQLPKPDFATYADGMAEIARLADEGRLRAIVDRTFPLAEAGAAISYLASGKALGKVVLTVEGDVVG